MKKLVIAALPIAALIVAAPAWADDNPTNPGVGDKGYCSQPGCIQKQTGGPGWDAQRSTTDTGNASGAYGAFGPGNPGGTYNAGGGSAGGANVPGTTGYNNSHVGK